MMRVPLLDLKLQYQTIRDEIREAIDRVCESQYFIMGPEVAELEKSVARYCGAQHAIGVSSGTDALLIALMAAGVGQGDEVITTTYSFFATAGVIARLGARPVFVDIDSKNFNIAALDVERRISAKTKAIIPVHLFGQCAEMTPILEAVKGRNITIIEDAAQAIGSVDENGRHAGSIGDMGCFSFFPSKNLGAFGDGGMVVTNDERLAESLRVLRVHGGKPKYYHSVVGGNFRLDAIQAAVLNVKLKYLSGWTQRRRENASLYRESFRKLSLPKGFMVPEDCAGHIYNQFVPMCPERDQLQAFLKDRGVETEVYYPVPLHLQKCFAEFGYRAGEFPKAECAARDSLALPIFPELTPQQIAYAADQVGNFYDSKH